MTSTTTDSNPDGVGLPRSRGDQSTRVGISDGDPSSSIDVSFIVAARDVAPFIAEAIGSALRQEGCSIEVVVVDDASRDATASIVADLAREDPRVRLLRLPESRGASAARNVAMAAACGTWIAVLDGDDRIAPDRSARLLEAAALWSADIVADNVMRFDELSSRRSTMMPLGPHPYSFFLQADEYIRSISPMAGSPNFGYLKPMFRHSRLKEHSLVYREDLRIGEDSQICLEALLAGLQYLVVSEASYHYRVRPGSLSWRLEQRDVAALEHATIAAVRARSRVETQTSGALSTYLSALERAKVILRVIDSMQNRRPAEAVRLVMVTPSCWSFMLSVLAGRCRRFTRRRLQWRSA